MISEGKIFFVTFCPSVSLSMFKMLRYCCDMQFKKEFKKLQLKN